MSMDLGGLGINNPKVSEWVAAFYDPTMEFAGELFQTAGENPANSFDEADFFAVGLLGDVRIFPLAARSLLGDARLREDVSRNLEEVPVDKNIWECPGVLARECAGWELWDLLRNLDGVGPTTASKLLARKRPAIFPIYDSRVHEGIGVTVNNFWDFFAYYLKDPMRREQVEELRPDSVMQRVIPTLRLLDSAIWMKNSQSALAKAVRA